MGITNQGRTVFKLLGVSIGFPVLNVKTETWAVSMDSMDSSEIAAVRPVLAQI